MYSLVVTLVMKRIVENSIMMLSIIIIIMMHSSSLAELSESCLYPPCRYNVYREEDDNGNVVVNDASSHVINWNWDVKGGRWNVTYRYTYPDGWYEGIAIFMNCSNILSNKEQPFVSWGSSKSWKSNSIPIYANAWNITYNGDVFGFIPTENGKYIFRIFTRNKRHSPFGDELVVPPGSCLFQSPDKAKIKMWWTDRKRLKNCPESVFTWSWETSAGRWRVMYKWVTATEKISSSVFYRERGKNEENIINWELNVPQNLVAYKTKPIRISGEPAWSIDLGPTEIWGFSPTGQGKWIFQLFSRNVIFQPFIDEFEISNKEL